MIKPFLLYIFIFPETGNSVVHEISDAFHPAQSQIGTVDGPPSFRAGELIGSPGTGMVAIIHQYIGNTHSPLPGSQHLEPEHIVLVVICVVEVELLSYLMGHQNRGTSDHILFEQSGKVRLGWYEKIIASFLPVLIHNGVGSIDEIRSLFLNQRQLLFKLFRKPQIITI